VLKVILLALIFNGCTQQVVSSKLPDQHMLDHIDVVSVRVLDSDVELYTAYIHALRNKINFYEKQILDYRELQKALND